MVISWRNQVARAARRDFAARDFELVFAAQVPDRHRAFRDFVGALHEHEADARAVGVFELTRELAGLDHGFGVDARVAQLGREREIARKFGFVHLCDECIDRAATTREQARFAQLPVQTRHADRDADARQLRLRIVAR